MVQENLFTRFEHVCKWFTKEFTNGSEKVQKNVNVEICFTVFERV